VDVACRLVTEWQVIASVPLRRASLPTGVRPAHERDEALDDVEGFFLAPEVLRHPPRNEQQMAEWLGHAGNALRRAVEHRKQIERLTKEHGPDAKVR
jgi:hypothetical protein